MDNGNRTLIDAWYSQMWNPWDKAAFAALLCYIPPTKRPTGR